MPSFEKLISSVNVAVPDAKLVEPENAGRLTIAEL
jgi:hypothetical protein